MLLANGEESHLSNVSAAEPNEGSPLSKNRVGCEIVVAGTWLGNATPLQERSCSSGFTAELSF